ncbi:uncharacterized protein [Palaemon carinicauda]|uniref:uncharacterized protein n=1 Tax=Palaemon carinicauda TaxID=392227 RepID=UPI0035B68602
MVSYCVVIGCGNDSECEIDKTFFQFPRVIQNAEGKQNVLSLLRQQAWIANLSSSNLNFEDLNDYRVCSDHFVQGKPCSLNDVENIDWVPSQNLSRTGDSIRKDRRNKESPKGREKKTVTPNGFVFNKEITTSKCEPVVDVGVQENNYSINVSEKSKTSSSGALNGLKSRTKDCMKSLNSSEKILKLLKEIRWDHCYSKKADASEGGNVMYLYKLYFHDYTDKIIEF